MNTINNSVYVNKTYDKSYTNKKTTSTLSAIINNSKDNNSYNLKFEDNTSLNVDKALISGNVGDKINVRVEEKNGVKSFISQILDSSDSSIIDMLEKSTNSEVRDDLNYFSFLNENGLEATAENAKTLRDIKAYINSIISSGGEASVAKLMAMGIDIGNISIDALSRLVYEANTANLDALSNKEENFSEFLSKNPEISSDERKTEIAKALFEQGLPINDSNISKMENLLDKAENLPSLNDSEIISFLKQNNSVSIDNIYKAKYNNSEKVAGELNEKVWLELKAQVEGIFERDDIEPTKENFEAAKALIENEIAVNGENINKISFLKNPKVSQECLLKLASQALAQGQELNLTDMTDLGSEGLNIEEIASNYSETMKYINFADEYDIQRVIDDNKEINLKNIVEEAKNNENNRKAEIEPSKEAVTAKRQLLEIQLKLTSESAARLCQKGIDINTEPLKEAINQLKAVENELYSKSLENAGADVNAKSLEILTQSINKVNSLSIFMNESSNYSLIFNKATAPTINEISNVATNNILATLDTFATAPSQKFGDSYSQVKGQLEDVLNQNDIVVTEENLRAAEILSRNGIDITEENILKIKITDTKINTIYDKLHPMTVANMLKEGINPLEISIDEVLSYINLYSDNYEQENRDKIAEYIIQADENKALSQEERSAVTAIYKALSYISKNNSKDLGAAVFAENSSTIGDILEIAKAVKKAKKGVDKSIDNESELKLSRERENGIKNTIENAIKISSDNLEKLKDEYTVLLQERLVALSAPTQLLEFIKGKGSEEIFKTTLEELYYGLKKISEANEDSFISKEKIQELATQIQNMEKGGADIVAWLNENNIPLTLNNINNVAKLLKDAFANGKEFEELQESLAQESDLFQNTFGYDDVISAVDKAEEVVEEMENSIYDLEDLSKINLILKQCTAVKNSLSFKHSLNDNSENYYQIPIRLKNNKIADLNMYVLNSNNNDNSFQGFLNLETNNLGVIQGYISVNAGNVNVHMTTENAENESYLASISASLYEGLKLAGFEEIEISFGQEKVLNIFAQEDSEEIIENLENSFSALI